jgi:NADH dehydrogenase/NADH:ubiquinone oxidoreductase subunit G
VDGNLHTLLQYRESKRIAIPRFCFHEKLSIVGNCRVCMVEVEGVRKPVIACATEATSGPKIRTNSVLARVARENIIEFLLINHPLDCPICDQGGECDLQDQTVIYGSDRSRYREQKRSVTDKNFGPLVKAVMTRCTHCTRCIRHPNEPAGTKILGTLGRGVGTEIGTYVELPLTPEISGNVIDLCPVGALTTKPSAYRARS